jgi:hypothetical protein
MNFRLLFYVLVIGFLAACSNVSFTPDLSSQAGSWQDISGVLGNGSVGRFSDIALDSAGSPVVVWETRTVMPTKVQVSDETTGVWTLLPDPARDPSRTSSTPSVAIRSDNRPVVAYVESYLENSQTFYNLYLRRWNGTSWVNVGNSLNVRKGYQVTLPSVALDKTGTTPTNYPTVAWTEWNGTNDDARVIRRTAAGWQRLGTLDLNASDSAWFGTSSLQLGKSGQPVVAWVNHSNQSGSDVIGLYVKKWNGSGWESYDVAQNPLNNTSKNLKSFALALDKNDRPVVAWVEDKLVNTPLYHSRVLRIKRWNGTQWAAVLNESYTYQYFTTVADSLSLVVNSLNQPVIAYTRWNGAKNLVRLKERTSTGVWVEYGEVLNSNPPIYVTGENPSLGLQGGTIPIVSFTENNNGYIAVKKWIP